MDKNTTIADAIDATDKKAQYDACCKHLLSFKQILGYIMCSVVDEFSGMKWQDAMQYIEGEPIIGDGCVDANMPEQIHGESTEDSTITDGERKFDILFRASLPESEDKIELIINIEVQNNSNPGYSLLKRGIYYCARLISRQLGRDFTKSDYDSIKKVYSIWICTNSQADFANTVTSYNFHRSVKHGKPAKTAEEQKKDYDLMSLNMICIGDAESEEYSGIIEFLGTLLSNTLSKEARKTTLNEKFEMAMTEKIDEEVENMCNLSYVIEKRGIELGTERGIELGTERGIELGTERGIKLGMKRGLEQGLEQGTIQAKREMILGLKDELPIEKIAQISKLSVKEVEDILNSNQ